MAEVTYLIQMLWNRDSVEVRGSSLTCSSSDQYHLKACFKYLIVTYLEMKRIHQMTRTKKGWYFVNFVGTAKTCIQPHLYYYVYCTARLFRVTPKIIKRWDHLINGKTPAFRYKICCCNRLWPYMKISFILRINWIFSKREKLLKNCKSSSVSLPLID